MNKMPNDAHASVQHREYAKYRKQFLAQRRRFAALSGLDLGEPLTEAEFKLKYGGARMPQN